MAENYAPQAPGAMRAGPPNGETRAELRLILRALTRAGIGEPKRSELARLPHMSARLVEDWQAELVESRGDKYTTGLLVHVLQLGEPPPGRDYPELLHRPELHSAERLVGGVLAAMPGSAAGAPEVVDSAEPQGDVSWPDQGEFYLARGDPPSG